MESKFTGKDGGPLPNDEYWIARAEEIEDITHKKALAVEKELDKLYRFTIADIQSRIEAFLFKYATDNHLTLQEAELILTGVDLIEYKNKMNGLLRQYKSSSNPYALDDIQRLTKTGQVTRLQGLIDELTVQLGMFSHNAQISMEDLLEDVYEEAYYRTIYSIEQGTGIGIAFTKVNQEAIKQVLTYKWSGDMFSSRIWRNRDKLITTLKDELTKGLVQGISIHEMARNLRDKMNTSTFNASRIIRTETNFVLGQATAKGYEEVGLNKYQFLATLDSRTSKVCGKMDGKVFLLKDKKVGVNFPPLHPSCRSTIIPYLDKKAEKELRIARDKNNKNTHISAKTTFEDWKKQKSI